MKEFVELCEKCMLEMIEVSRNIVEWVSTPIYDLIVDGGVPEWIVSLLPNSSLEFLRDTSVFAMMFGTGLFVFFGIVLVKFIMSLK